MTDDDDVISVRAVPDTVNVIIGDGDTISVREVPADVAVIQPPDVEVTSVREVPDIVNVIQPRASGPGGPYLPLRGGEMTGDIDMGGNRIFSTQEAFENGQPVEYSQWRQAITDGPRIQTLSDLGGHTYQYDWRTVDQVRIDLPTADFTLLAPAGGTPTDGFLVLVKVRSGATGYTMSFDAIFVSSPVAELPTFPLTSGKTASLGFMYDLESAVWVLMAVDAIGY